MIGDGITEIWQNDNKSAKQNKKHSYFYVIGRKNDEYYYVDSKSFCSNPIYAHQFGSVDSAKKRIRKLSYSEEYEILKIDLEYTMEPVED